MFKHASFVRLIVASATLCSGCGGSKEEASYPPPGGGNSTYVSQGGQNGGYTTIGNVNGSNTQVGGAATSSSAPITTTSPAVQELDASLATPVKPMLLQLAQTQLQPGAKPVGNAILANFLTGGTLTKPITLTVNKCYSVVAAGGPGVGEVNVKFTPLIPMLPAFAEDKSTGPLATLGAAPNCYKQMLISAQVNLVIEVPQGQGMVGVQLYEK
jgi:hypothetical protein